MVSGFHIEPFLWSPTTPVLHLLIADNDCSLVYYLKDVVENALLDVGLRHHKNFSSSHINFKDLASVYKFIDILKKNGFEEVANTTKFDKANNRLLIILKREKATISVNFTSEVILLRYDCLEVYQCMRILVEFDIKIKNGMPKKKAILACQKALIDNGFVGNASW
jgi:hypothetical protein